MKYIALIYSDPSKEPAYGTPEFDTFMSGYFALSAKLKADGVYIAGDGLENASTATTLRIRGGKTETMDGPFAETKEQLGGYYVFDDATVSSCIGATEVVEDLVIRRDGLNSEQIYPHFVFRAPGA